MTLAPVLVPLQFCSAIVLIFFLELAVAVLAFLFQDWVRDRFREFFESNIRSYRDDIDLQNLIDSLQKAVSTTWLLPDSAQLSGLQSVCTARGRMANTGSPSSGGPWEVPGLLSGYPTLFALGRLASLLSPQPPSPCRAWISPAPCGQLQSPGPVTPSLSEAIPVSCPLPP